MAEANSPAPLSNADQIRGRITQLQEALESGSPNYAGLLHTIHQALLNDEETANLLEESEIQTICLGLAKRKNVVISESVAKSSKTKSITLADL